MQLDIAVLSRQGGRESNEDACGYWSSDHLCCCVLSDGAGGHGGGDVASKLVVKAVLEAFAAAPRMSSAAISEALATANSILLTHQRDEPRVADMRATAAVLLFDLAAGTALWGHVGDSRVYCFRAGTLVMQTRDHSVAQTVADRGLADGDFLRGRPYRNVLLSALGSPDRIETTVADTPLPVRDGDAFLLCSDGLWEYVNEEVMEQALSGADSAQDWLNVLEAELLRNARPGHDNYSAVGVWTPLLD